VSVRVLAGHTSHHRPSLPFGSVVPAATSLCRWVGALFRIWWCFAVFGEDVLFLPAEVVVLARFWRLGEVFGVGACDV
jgi:hypothetical protein